MRTTGTATSVRDYVLQRWWRLNAPYRRTFKRLQDAVVSRDSRASSLSIDDLARMRFWPDASLERGALFPSVLDALRKTNNSPDETIERYTLGKRGPFYFTWFCCYTKPIVLDELRVNAHKTPRWRPTHYLGPLRPWFVVVDSAFDVLLVVDVNPLIYATFRLARARAVYRRTATPVRRATVHRWWLPDGRVVSVLRLLDGKGRLQGVLAGSEFSAVNVVKLPKHGSFSVWD